jgi:hypothetical protein
MKERKWRKPFVCRIGLHDWQGLSDGAGIRNQYAVEMRCNRCGARKIEALNQPHDHGGLR